MNFIWFLLICFTTFMTLNNLSYLQEISHFQSSFFKFNFLLKINFIFKGQLWWLYFIRKFMYYWNLCTTEIYVLQYITDYAILWIWNFYFSYNYLEFVLTGFGWQTSSYKFRRSWHGVVTPYIKRYMPIETIFFWIFWKAMKSIAIFRTIMK